MLPRDPGGNRVSEGPGGCALPEDPDGNVLPRARKKNVLPVGSGKSVPLLSLRGLGEGVPPVSPDGNMFLVDPEEINCGGLGLIRLSTTLDTKSS